MTDYISQSSHYIEEKLLTKDSTKKTARTKSRILLVEDDMLAQMAAKILLNGLNCEVITANNAETAIELCKRNQYDLIIMDIGLPDKNGIDASKEIRTQEEKSQHHTPIVVLTASSDEKIKKLSAEAGIEKILLKPLREEIASAVLNCFVYSPSAKLKKMKKHRN